ncbi:MAG: YeeE/YedE family protein [Gammaproteobacteria bacterium]|nr:YeeE/YedE family protein [Gammaproteobacteria bacterium]
MKSAVRSKSTDQTVVLMASLAIFAIALFVQQAIAGLQYLTFIIGVGLGVTLMHAAFGFSGSWRMFIRERDGKGVRAHIFLLGLTSLLFFPLLGQVFPSFQASAALAPVGTSVLVGAFLFGIGMQLGGGCGSGTLYTMGQGQIDMLITLTFFIVGATLGSAHLHWWLSLPGFRSISVIEYFGWWQALVLQIIVLGVLYTVVRVLELRRKGSVDPVAFYVPAEEFNQRLIHGQWPLLWGVFALALLNLATLIVAGHPWSVTYAFGLWGAKLWSAVGGDPGSWAYWSSGYTAHSLKSSVLADTTSLMDFGIILGALLAAALADKFAPAMKLSGLRIMTAIVGGLLLGYGARLSFGCNIGALVAGVSSGSLHGWLWLVAAFCGGIAGVYIRIWLKLDKPMVSHA